MRGSFMQQELLLVTATFFILFVIFTAISVYLLNHFSKNQKHKTIVEGEYSNSTLFFPWKEGLALKDSIMMFFVSPYFWFFEFLSVVIFALLMLLGLLSSSDDKVYSITLFIAAGLVSFTFTFFYAVLLWLSDYKEREPLRFIPTLFLWGAMAVVSAVILEVVLEIFLGIVIPAEFSALLVVISTVFSAPLIEEFTKGFGVLVMSYHHEFDGVMDGIVFGFIIGAGFAFLEDWGYYLTYSPTEIGMMGWLELIILRTVLTSTVHGVFTAFTGAILGIFKERGIRGKWLAFPAIILVGGFAHMVFNSLTIVDGMIGAILQTDLPLCLGGFTILLVLILAALIKKSLDKEKEYADN